MDTKKDLNYYLKLKWSFTIEQESFKNKDYYIIRVNELPGVCTDAETIEEGMREIKDAIKAAIKLYLKKGELIPEPIRREDFKGNISYRTSSKRHFYLAKLAKEDQKSISKTLDMLVDEGLDRFFCSSTQERRI